VPGAFQGQALYADMNTLQPYRMAFEMILGIFLRDSSTAVHSYLEILSNDRND